MTAGRPLVALTTSFDPEAGSHRRPQIVLYGAYIAALDAAGLAAVLVSPSHSPDSIDSLISQCSGLCLSGGGDIDPHRYGEEPGPDLDSVSPERDEAECRALRAAMDLGLPVLGICRGIQLMNVYFGGTLYQDIDRDFPMPGVEHQQEGPWSARTHDVAIHDRSMLRRIVGEPVICINSFHHQAVKDVPAPLTVTAVAEDGLVEAVEMTDYPWGIAVQWHPERHEATAPNTDPDRRLFQAFADAVESYHTGRRVAKAG